MNNSEEVFELYPEYNTIYGPYPRSDGRKHVILYSSITFRRKTISYPKLVMELHLKRRLEEWEEVDHKNDVLDDSIENLQILTKSENVIKSKALGIYRRCLCGDVFKPKRKEQKFCNNVCRCNYTKFRNQYS